MAISGASVFHKHILFSEGFLLQGIKNQDCVVKS